MLRLELDGVPATLVNLNPRVEKSGADKIPAADLQITVAQGSEILANFSPVLRHMLFDDKAPKDLAEGMPLRDPHMVYPLERDEEMVGATVTIDYGVKDVMVFADVKINKFRITPYAGGSVIVGFRVQCRPDEKQAGRLYTLQEQAITLTVEPVELNEMQDAA